MFLDRCDICHKPKKCKGYNNMVVCDDCAEQIKQNYEGNNNQELTPGGKINKDKDLMITIFDFM